MRRLALVLLVVLGACANDQTNQTPAPRESRARIVRSGFSVHDMQIGVAATVRVDGDETLRRIGIRATFIADGKRLGTRRDTLAFCPPRTECGWGQSLFGENLHDDWASVDRVDVRIGARGTGGEDGNVGELDIETTDARVVVTPSGEQGTVYLVAFDDHVPRGGYSFFTQDGETNELRYTQRIFPRDEGTKVKGYFYPGPIPERVGGPVD